MQNSKQSSEAEVKTNRELVGRRVETVVLLPCPFCGGEAKYRKDCCEHIVYCEGRSCLVEPCTFGCPSKEVAVDAWNTREKLISNVCPSCGKAVDPAGYCNHCDAMGGGPYQQS